MNSENLKFCLKALTRGLAGALACTVVLPIVSYSITRICFPAALSNTVFVEQLWFNPMALVIGGIVGSSLVLRQGSQLAKSVAGGLCLWMGTCGTIIPILFIVQYTWMEWSGAPMNLKNVGHPMAFAWAIFFPTALLALVPLQIGRRLYSFHWEMSLGVVGQGIKAMAWPNPANRMQNYTLSCPLGTELFLEKVRERAERAQNPISRAILLPLRHKKDVIATIKRNALILVSGRANTGYYVRTEFSEKEEGTVLKLRSEPQIMLRVQMVWFFGVLGIATVAAISGSVIALVSKGAYQEFLGAVLTLSIAWYVVTSLFRLTQFLGKRQEQAILQWLTQNFDARLVETLPVKRKFILF